MLIEPAPYHKDKPFGEIVRTETRKQPWKDYIKVPEVEVKPADPTNRKMKFGYKQAPPQASAIKAN